MSWELSLTGLLIGLLVGMTGMGGGALLTPLLILFFRVQADACRGDGHPPRRRLQDLPRSPSLALGSVHARLTLWMLAASAPMSLVGVQLAESLEGRNGGVDSASAKVIGAALILGGLGFLAKTFIRRGVQPDNAPTAVSLRSGAAARG